MKTQRVTVALIALNLVVMLFIAARPKEDHFEKIIVKEFEMVDENGKERASIKIESDGGLVFRLRDSQENVRVKLGANNDGAGLVLLDNETNPGVHVLSTKNKTSITLTGKDGKKREF